jgi:hypothetical protein
VASRSNASTVFGRSITGVVGSNPTHSVFMSACVGRGLAKGSSPV